jgi:hypothetical protein
MPRPAPSPTPGPVAQGRLSELLRRCGYDLSRLPPADRARAEELAKAMGVQLLAPSGPPTR